MVVFKPRAILFENAHLIICFFTLFFAHTDFSFICHLFCIFGTFTQIAPLLILFFRLREFLSDWIGDIINRKFG